jgi:hypothetical protein
MPFFIIAHPFRAKMLHSPFGATDLQGGCNPALRNKVSSSPERAE